MRRTWCAAVRIQATSPRADLAEKNLLDILSSDYIPFSLIQSVFHLEGELEQITLPEAIRMVSKNPAEACGLSDRGEIAIGKRGDLVRIGVDHAFRSCAPSGAKAGAWSDVRDGSHGGSTAGECRSGTAPSSPWSGRAAPARTRC